LHPDISPNIIGSWDAENASSPSVQYPTSLTDEVNHGTGTAGILVAQQNSIGLSGVAPNCTLLPISLDFGNSGQDVIFSAGFTHAYLSGASVLSNSWGGGSGYSLTDDAISDALTLGRPINGGLDHLGCVVVFAAGNDNNNGISSPGQDNTDILVAGATSICKERKRYWAINAQSCEDGELWGSNYGIGLGVMAPGIRITTTDNQSTTSTPGAYRNDFNGTSAATPQVAGVAALILSLYPCLTQEQVVKIIEQSAWKINTSMYSYSSTIGEPNGTWNNEMGYGFLDAYASLNTLVNFSYLQHDDVTDAQKKYSLNFIRAGYNVNSSLTAGNYTIGNTANVEIKAAHYITFEPGFTAISGAVMNAHIATYTGDCTNWVPTLNKTNTVNGNLQSDDDYNNNSITKDLNSTITFVPNPFKNSFTVNYQTLTDNDNTMITVYDLTGRLVYEHSNIDSKGYHDVTIPVNSSASMFIVRTCINGKCTSQKMVKYEID